MNKVKNLLRAVVLVSLGSALLAQAASQPAVEAKHGMVVSSQRLASEVGVRIMQQGGNAVDAAVAVGYALAVVNPCCGNIGGGGFMTIHLADGRNTFLNFREMAPAAATERMYLDAQGNPIKNLSLYGYLAAGVPGTVMGLDRALAEYGRLPRSKVMAPAIKLARGGFILNRGDTDILDTKVDRLSKDPAAAKIFLRPDGKPFQPGDRLVQKDLASTLELIARQGPDAFYKGPIALAVEQASKANGGILTARGFRQLQGDRRSAPDLQLPGIRPDLFTAAEFGWHHDLRNPQYSRRLRHEGAGLPLGPIGSPDGRSHAPCFPGSQHVSGRPGVREKSARSAAVQGLCNCHSRQDRSGESNAIQSGSAGYRTTRENQRRRIIRWLTPRGMQSPSPTPSTTRSDRP